MIRLAFTIAFSYNGIHIMVLTQSSHPWRTPRKKSINYAPFIENAQAVAATLPRGLSDIELSIARDEQLMLTGIHLWPPHSTSVWTIAFLRAYLMPQQATLLNEVMA